MASSIRTRSFSLTICGSARDRTSPPIHQWADRVRGQLTVELAGIQNVTLIALAGEQYRTVLLGSPWPSEVPMKGLGIGQQLEWLTGKLTVAEPT